jgi:hypothetical protein
LIDKVLPEHCDPGEGGCHPLENERNLDRLPEVDEDVGSDRRIVAKCARRDLVIAERHERSYEHARVRSSDRAGEISFRISNRDGGRDRVAGWVGGGAADDAGGGLHLGGQYCRSGRERGEDESESQR